jgi:hypothetical protein
VAGDSLSGFKGAVIFQKICDAGRAFASANTPVLCLVLLLLASQTDGGFRLIRTGLAVTLPVSRLARRSIFILAYVLADPATTEPFTPELRALPLPPVHAPVTSGWSSSCRVGYLPPTGRARSFHGPLGF